MSWSTRQQVKWVNHLKTEGLNKPDHPMYSYYVSEVRSLREMFNRKNDDNCIVVKNYDEGALIRFPIGQWSDLETAKEYAENFRLYCRSPYDCSGELFTAWQEVHFWQGQYWCWQSNHLNV